MDEGELQDAFEGFEGGLAVVSWVILGRIVEEGRKGGQGECSWGIFLGQGKTIHHLRTARGSRRVGGDFGGFGIFGWGGRGWLFSVRLEGVRRGSC